MASLSLLPLIALAQMDVLHLKSDVVDTIFGKPVADPYRWMEDLTSDSVKQWLQEQKKITRAEQKHFNGRMANAASNMEFNAGYSHKSAEKTGRWYFEMISSRDPLKPSPILYYRKNMEEVFEPAFNPNNINEHTLINQWAVSDNGEFLAVALSTGGSDWLEIRVRDLDKDKDLRDKINWVKFSNIVWWKDGFFYARYKGSGQTTALGGQQLYYHKLGDSQDEDKPVITSRDNEGTIQFKKTSNGRYLVLNKNQKINETGFNIVAYIDLNEGLYSEWKYIAQTPSKDKAYFEVIDYADSGFIVYTDYKSPKGRVLLANTDHVNHFVEIVPESDKVLNQVSYVHHEVVAMYFTKGVYEVDMYKADGQLLHGIKFPAGTEVEGFKGSPDDSETIFYQSTFYVPKIISRYNFNTQKNDYVDKTSITYHFDDYKTEVVNYRSKDGTEVSMYLTYKRGLNLKGNNPVILYGYGAFGISVKPDYSYTNIVFFNNGGILAVPMIRGGGELGEEWHEGGQRLNKQNSFDDFTAAAQYLIHEGYTSKEKLAIEGGSNGGLVVAAVMTQHPELCQVVVGQAGVYDMLRYHKFTGGKHWLGEYGNPDNSLDFDNLLSYSPLHNVKPGISYPATLLITGRNDDRVVPFHTYKFLAALQECSSGDKPHVMYFEEDAGHGGARGFSERNEQDAFILAFIFTEMHLPLK